MTSPLLRNVPSCGLTLLRGPPDTFDYVLYVTADDKAFVRIHCHRAVLLAHSKKMRRLITGENYFEMTIKVLPGFVGAFVEVLQYMYLKDPTLITHRSKMKEMICFLEMPFDHWLVKEEKLRVLNNHEPCIYITLEHDQHSTCLLAKDFLNLFSTQNVRMRHHSCEDKSISTNDEPEEEKEVALVQPIAKPSPRKKKSVKQRNKQKPIKKPVTKRKTRQSNRRMDQKKPKEPEEEEEEEDDSSVTSQRSAYQFRKRQRISYKPTEYIFV